MLLAGDSDLHCVSGRRSAGVGAAPSARPSQLPELKPRWPLGEGDNETAEPGGRPVDHWPRDTPDPVCDAPPGSTPASPARGLLVGARVMRAIAGCCHLAHAVTKKPAMHPRVLGCHAGDMLAKCPSAGLRLRALQRHRPASGARLERWRRTTQSLRSSPRSAVGRRVPPCRKGNAN